MTKASLGINLPSEAFISITLEPTAHSQYAGELFFVTLDSPKSGRKMAEVDSIWMFLFLQFRREM